MAFTLTFLRYFVWGIFLFGPILLVLVSVIAGLGMSVGRREGWTRADSLYYAFITGTTVGYGDFRPRAGISKLMAICIALTGLIMTGIVVSIGVQAAMIAFERHYDLHPSQPVSETSAADSPVNR